LLISIFTFIKLPAGYLEQFGAFNNQPSSSKGIASTASATQSSTSVVDVDEQTNLSTLSSESNDNRTTEGGSGGLSNKPCASSNESQERRQQLDNIAQVALEFQPSGYTLETTHVGNLLASSCCRLQFSMLCLGEN